MTTDDPIRPVRSIVAPSALGQVIEQRYGLRVRSAVLLRSLVNDLYRIDTARRRYAAKLYRTNDPASARGRLSWEVALVDHLRASGQLGVPPIRRTAEGESLVMVQAPEGSRALVISEWLDGSKPKPPYDDDLYERLGRLAARFHAATDGFFVSPDTTVFDLDRCLEQPLAAIEPMLRRDRPNVFGAIRHLATAARDRLTADPPGDHGIGHGDVTLDNILITDAGMTLHDFDRTGVRWRVADLAGVAGTDHLAAFVRGYREVRDLSDHDLAALPWLRVADLVGNLAFHLVDKPGFRGVESINEGFAEREIDALSSLATELLGPSARR